MGSVSEAEQNSTAFKSVHKWVSVSDGSRTVGVLCPVNNAALGSSLFV